MKRIREPFAILDYHVLSPRLFTRLDDVLHRGSEVTDVRLVLLSVAQMKRLDRTSHVRAVSPGLMTVVSSAALLSPSRFGCRNES